MAKRARSEVHGVLVVDKARGPTSHDVVARARRALGTRAVGHAGTLDPMATGVLVLAVGEGTKLVRWLTTDDKIYSATVALGAETDTLDADGQVVEEVPAVEIDLPRVRAAAAAFVGTYDQVPPVYSAIKVDGERLHERARRGETVEVAARRVTVHRLDVLHADATRIDLEVHSAKGFYVRSLGRDLARALGTRGHLTSLRRTQSGAFALAAAIDGETLERAAGGDEAARAEVRAAVLALPEACQGMPSATLDAEGVSHARHGRPIGPSSVVGEIPADDVEPLAMLDVAGRLVAIGARRDGVLHVVRGVRVGD